MDSLFVLFHVALIWVLAVATPGANVLLTINTALHYERNVAIFSAFGVSTATLLWSFFGGSGLVILFTTFPQLFDVMKILGGSYLLYLGIRQIYLTRKKPKFGNGADAHQMNSPSKKRVFVSALITSILNPKTGFFVLSLFSISMPADMSVWLMLAIMLTMASITLCWHLILAVAFSHDSAKNVYSRISHVIDYISGGIFTVFGLKVIAS